MTPSTSAAPASPAAAAAPAGDGLTNPTEAAQRVSAFRPLRLAAPLRWLAAGARDLRAAWPVSLFFGLCFWAMAVIVGLVFRGSPQYTMTIVSGCFLVGPFLSMGLYESSRRREAGLPQDLGASLTCWDGHIGSMAMLVLVLIVLELLWGRASLVVFAVFFNTGMPSTTGVVQAIFNAGNVEFLAAYTLVGGIFAALVFATCVVSIPMILDRDTDAVTGGLHSIQLVMRHPGVMLLWGALIVALTVGALLLPWAVGIWLVAPWLGHATWHAYRGAIDPAGLPVPPAGQGSAEESANRNA